MLWGRCKLTITIAVFLLILSASVDVIVSVGQVYYLTLHCKNDSGGEQVGCPDDKPASRSMVSIVDFCRAAFEDVNCSLTGTTCSDNNNRRSASNFSDSETVDEIEGAWNDTKAFTANLMMFEDLLSRTVIGVYLKDAHQRENCRVGTGREGGREEGGREGSDEGVSRM